MKQFLFYLVVIIIATASFLFSPPPQKNLGPDKDCPVQYVRLNSVTGFRMNCDAIEFTGLAVNPGLLLLENSRRQSRPLYIITGSIIGRLVYFISTPFHHRLSVLVPPRLKSQLAGKDEAFYLSHYIGLVLLNVLVLLAAFYCFEKLVEQYSGKWRNGMLLRSLVLIFLLSNNLTKVFFFTPHQQLFNILLPLLACWLAQRIMSYGRTNRELFLLALAGGLLLLYYGSFLFLFPVMFIAAMYHEYKAGKKSMGRYIKSIVLLTTGFMLPLLSWMLILQTTGNDFYSHETSYYRQFIWIADAITAPGRSLLPELFSNLSVYLSTFMPVIIPAAFLLLCFLVRKREVSPDLKVRQTPPSISLNTLLLISGLFLFFWLLGFYADRLTYTLAPLLILYGTILLNRYALNRNRINVVIVFITAWHLYLLFNEMPHFSERYFF